MTTHPENVAIVGCGYVGSALGQHLAGAGRHVLATTRTPERAADLKAKGLRAETWTIGDAPRLCELLADRYVVYLTVAAGGYDADYRDVYLQAAHDVVEALRCTPVRRVIYTSSTGVYAQDDGSWVDEDSPAEGKSENSRALVQAEQVLLSGMNARGATDPVHVTVLRLSGIYGPGRDHRQRITAHAGTTRSDGNVFINMVHLDDIVEVLTRLADVKHQGVLNLSDDRPLLRREYHDRLLAEADLPPITWTDADSTPRGKRVRNEKVKKLLNLQLEHPAH